MKTYKHYDLVDRGGTVYVYDPRWPDDHVYVADNMKAAKSWVTAYRDGVQWACAAALR